MSTSKEVDFTDAPGAIPPDAPLSAEEFERIVNDPTNEDIPLGTLISGFPVRSGASAGLSATPPYPKRQRLAKQHYWTRRDRMARYGRAPRRRYSRRRSYRRLPYRRRFSPALAQYRAAIRNEQFKDGNLYRGMFATYHPRTAASLAEFGPSWHEADDAQKLARQQKRMVGRGSYLTRMGIRGNVGDWLKKAGRNKNVQALIRDGAVMAGQRAGLDGGAVYDAVTGKGMYSSGVTGRGAYTNSLFLPHSEQNVPIRFGVVDEPEGNSIIITNCEKICDIYGNSLIDPTDPNSKAKPFESAVYDINPGNFLTFPELSQYASNWTKYEMIQLAFEFTSTIPDTFTTTNPQFGRVLMSTQYNPKAQMWTTAAGMDMDNRGTKAPINSIGEKTHIHQYPSCCECARI